MKYSASTDLTHPNLSPNPIYPQFFGHEKSDESEDALDFVSEFFFIDECSSKSFGKSKKDN